MLKKVFLHKLDFFIFVSRSLPGWPNAVVVCRPLSSFFLVVRCLICMPSSSATFIVCCCCHPPSLSSSTAAIVIRRRHRHPPQPSSPHHRFRLLSPPALVLPHPSLPPNLACCCLLPISLSAFTIVICRHHLLLPQPSSLLRSLRRLSPPSVLSRKRSKD